MLRRRFLAGAATVAAASPALAAGIGQPRFCASFPSYLTNVARSGGRGGPGPAPGETLRLERVPGRSYDPSSIRVLGEGGRPLGFLPPIHSRVVAPMIDAGLPFEAVAASNAGTPLERMTIAIVLL